jgi:hypothetical protein
LLPGLLTTGKLLLSKRAAGLPEAAHEVVEDHDAKDNAGGFITPGGEAAEGQKKSEAVDLNLGFPAVVEGVRLVTNG